MQLTSADLHLAGVVIAALTVEEVIREARHPMYGESKPDLLGSACYGLVLAVVALAVCRVLRGAEVIAIALAVPLAPGWALHRLSQHRRRVISKGIDTVIAQNRYQERR
jgi:hypothetical protein